MEDESTPKIDGCPPLLGRKGKHVVVARRTVGRVATESNMTDSLALLATE